MTSGLPVVDAHHHLWRIVPGRTVWPGPEDEHLYRDFELAELEPQLDAAGVDRTVLVQTEDSDADTDFLLEVADSSSRVAGVVGWVPLTDPALAGQRLDQLADRTKLVGVRSLVHRMGDDDWLLRDDVQRGLRLLADRGVPFDVVTDKPEQLRHVATIAARHPDLALVVDHLSKPPIGEPDVSAWQRELGRAAAFPNLWAKVSGLYPARAPSAGWDAAMLRPYLEIALDLFGADRLMLGSDWPVCLVVAGYERVWAVLHELTEPLSGAERVALRGGTAVRFYGLATGDG